MSHLSWSKHFTDDGDEYFYNADTQISQWERPDDYCSDAEVSANEYAATGELDVVDPNNIELQESSYSEQDAVNEYAVQYAPAESGYASYAQSGQGYNQCVHVDSEHHPETYHADQYGYSDPYYGQQYADSAYTAEAIPSEGENGAMSSQQYQDYNNDVTKSDPYSAGRQCDTYTEGLYEGEGSHTEATPSADGPYYGAASAPLADGETEPQSSSYEHPASSALYGRTSAYQNGHLTTTTDAETPEANELPYDTTIHHYAEVDLVDVIHFEFDEGADLLDELARLTLLDPPSAMESELILDGKWSRVACKKLEVLQMCLETTGTEEEWEWAFSHKQCIVMTYLQLFMDSQVHPILQDGASRCMAYGFMAYPSLWGTFAKLNPSIHHVYATLSTAGVRVKALLAMPPDVQPQVPYVGFDERDVKDFNMENMEEFDVEDSVKGPCDMDGAVDSSTAVSIWLLCLYQMIRSPSFIIRDKFLGARQHDAAGQKWLGEEDEGGSVDQILQVVTDILLCSNDMKESAYLQCIKFVTAINWQVPSRDSEINASSEIAELCANLQFMEEVASVNISEGLMHLLNDVGFPEHDVSETLPCLKLCCDLVMVPDFDGFFYSNDIKILVDVIIRELTNLPLICNDHLTTSAAGAAAEGSIVDGLDGPVENCKGEVPPVTERVRQLYLKLAYALMTRSQWPEIDGYYRKHELHHMLREIVETGEISYSTTLQLISQVLHVRYQSI